MCIFFFSLLLTVGKYVHLSESIGTGTGPYRLTITWIICVRTL